MPCLICRTDKTINAHLVPRAFALEVTSQKGEKHVVALNDDSRNFQSTNTGVYDGHILCGACDGVLGHYENYVFTSLKQFRAELVPSGTMLRVGGLNGDMFVRFAAGICWKYSVTRLENGRISIGPYIAALADVAFTCNRIPESVDVMAIQLQFGDRQSYFYRTPMPDRQGGVNVVRFSVGGFVFFLKIDKRPKTSLFSDECWLKGKTTGAFPVAPAEQFEEWQIHSQLRSATRLRSYFDRMLERPRTQ